MRPSSLCLLLAVSSSALLADNLPKIADDPLPGSKPTAAKPAATAPAPSAGPADPAKPLLMPETTAELEAKRKEEQKRQVEALAQFIKEKGNSNLTRAVEILNKKEFTVGELKEAINELELGIQRVPDNLDARLLYARLCFAKEVNAPAQGLQSLVDGLPFGAKIPAYMNQVVALLQEFGQDDTLIKLAGMALPFPAKPGEGTTPLALAAAGALQRRMAFVDAEMLIKDYDLTNFIEGILIKANILWQRGQKREATDLLWAGVRANSAEDRLLRQTLLCAREIKDWELADRIIIRRSSNSPTGYAGDFDAIVTRNLEGKAEKMKENVEQFLHDHRTNVNALNTLADFAVSIGRRDLVEQCRKTAAENGAADLSRFDLNFLEVRLKAKEYGEALSLIGKMESGEIKGFEGAGPFLQARRIICLYGQGQDFEAQGLLSEWLRKVTTPPQVMAGLAGALLEQEKYRPALDAARRAVNFAPSLAEAHTVIVEATLKLNEIVTGLDSLAFLLSGPGRASEELLKRVAPALAADAKKTKGDIPATLRNQYIEAVSSRLTQLDDLRTGQDRVKAAEAAKQRAEALKKAQEEEDKKKKEGAPATGATTDKTAEKPATPAAKPTPAPDPKKPAAPVKKP